MICSVELRCWNALTCRVVTQKTKVVDGKKSFIELFFSIPFFSMCCPNFLFILSLIAHRNFPSILNGISHFCGLWIGPPSFQFSAFFNWKTSSFMIFLLVFVFSVFFCFCCPFSLLNGTEKLFNSPLLSRLCLTFVDESFVQLSELKEETDKTVLSSSLILSSLPRDCFFEIYLTPLFVCLTPFPLSSLQIGALRIGSRPVTTVHKDAAVIEAFRSHLLFLYYLLYNRRLILFVVSGSKLPFHWPLVWWKDWWIDTVAVASHLSTVLDVSLAQLQEKIWGYLSKSHLNRFTPYIFSVFQQRITFSFVFFFGSILCSSSSRIQRWLP